MKEILKFKRRMLVEEAKTLFRLQELGKEGDEYLMRSIIRDEDFVKGNFPIAFVEHCIKKVDLVCEEVVEDYKKCDLKFQDNILEFWQGMDRRCKKKRPEVGDIVVMHYMKHNRLLTSGQFGIIVEVNRDLTFKTIEGNVISQFEDEPINTQTAGIKSRDRLPRGTNKMRVLGYFSPWIDRE